MTDKHITVTDALIARALSERASGPDVNLIPAIMTAAAATPQRTGWRLRFGRPPRSTILMLAAGALVASLIAVGVVGSAMVRPPSIARPLPGNGAITAGGSAQVVEFDALTGEEHPGALTSLPPSRTILGLDWSRDGTRLAISTDQDVSIYDAATGETRSLVPCGSCGATWSPDGTGLTIVDAIRGNSRGPGAGSFDVISMIDPDDGHKVSRIDRADGRSSEPDSGYPDRVQGVTWSPDGRRLAVSGSDAVYSMPRLAVMDRDGSNVRSISPPTPHWVMVDASWSPDGSTIAYIGFGVPDQNGKMSMKLALVDPDGVRPSQTFEVGECFCLGFSPGLTWSPDGRSIAFTANVDNSPGLYLANPDGSGIHLIMASPNGPIAWRPVPAPEQK